MSKPTQHSRPSTVRAPLRHEPDVRRVGFEYTRRLLAPESYPLEVAPAATSSSVHILTFDIEDWFHLLDHDSTRTESHWSAYEPRIEASVDRILQLLSDKEQRATFFCLGWIADRHPDVIRKIDAEGHEIGSHSYAHQLVYEQSPTEFKQDLARSVQVLEDLTGKKVGAFRAPGFSVTEDFTSMFHALAELEIEIDCSVFPTRRAHGGFSSFTETEPVIIDCGSARIKEFPLNLYRFLGSRIAFSGGGYFRLLPYWVIHRMMQRSRYVMTYFHPRDFDPGQPLLQDLSWDRRFKSYYGLSSAFGKLERLLSDFQFVDLTTASQAIDWNRTIDLQSA